MKKLFVVLSLFIAIGIASCKKEGTVTVYVKKHLQGQALQYADFATITVYDSASGAQVGTAEANQFGVAAVDLQSGKYRVYAETLAGTDTLKGESIATIKKNERVDVNVTIQ